MSSFATCSLDVDTTLPLLCICSVLSFLCGVGIGANDLSANFAMVVGSGSMNMKQAIICCTIFELLGASFMGGHVSGTIRNGIVEPTLFRENRDLVVIGMTCATFAAALWLYLSTVFGLPVSITHTVVGSIIGFAVFNSGGFASVKARGLTVIVISWVVAPLAALAVTAALFYYVRRDIFKVKGRSFELAFKALPFCLAISLFVDYFFIMIEKPPIMTQTIARYVPLWVQFVILCILIIAFCALVSKYIFPIVAEQARTASTFMWESPAVRTEVAPPDHDESEDLSRTASIFKPKHPPTPAPAAASHMNDPLLTDDVNEQSLSYLKKDTLGPNVRETDKSRPSTPNPSGLHPNSSLVLNSIDASDRRFKMQGKIQIAPVSRSHSAVRPANPDDSMRTAEGDLNSTRNSLFRTESGRKKDYGTLTVSEVANLKEVPSGTLQSSVFVGPSPSSPASVHSFDEFGDSDWDMDHPMEPIQFSGLLIKPFNPRAEFLFTGLQVVAGSMSSFVHGAVAGANATATFVILYEAFTNHELGETDLSASWSVIPAMLGIAIGMFGLGASLMKTVGVELVTVTPVRGWCIQVGGTVVTMILTGIGIPVSLSQAQVGAAIGCGVLDAKWKGVSWNIVGKIVGGWVVTLVISASTTALSIYLLSSYLC